MSGQQDFEAFLGKLSNASVKKRFHPYDDIAWDDPGFAIEPNDPRFILPSDRGLGGTEWYRNLAEPVRAEIGLAQIASQMRVGILFENVLSQGLLCFADSQPMHSMSVRYALHEVVEEGQHALMFHEFIRRVGLEAEPISPFRRRLARRVVGYGRTFPALFFIHVLAGEAPIDAIQREVLEREEPLHPLLKRVIRIHVTEEARHLAFAERYLEHVAPSLTAFQRLRLKIEAPLILAITASMMQRPPGWLVKRYAIPRTVLRAAFAPTSRAAMTIRQAFAGVSDVSRKIGILTPKTEPFWQRLGLIGQSSVTNMGAC